MYRSVLIVIVAISLILIPACSDDQHSKSVEEAETYDDLLMDFEYDEDDDEEDDDAEDDADVDEEVDSDNSSDDKDSGDAGDNAEEDEVDKDESGDKKKSRDTYKERLKEWKEHERWRDKEVDKFKTAEEYATYYHDEYIQLYMEQYYYDTDYRPDEASIREQSYLDAIHHWEVNQPWPKPKKDQIKTDTVK